MYATFYFTQVLRVILYHSSTLDYSYTLINNFKVRQPLTKNKTTQNKKYHNLYFRKAASSRELRNYTGVLREGGG